MILNAIKQVFLLFGFLLVHHVVGAQESKPTPFKLKFGYSSNQIYNGRADSLDVPYMTGSLKYLDPSGFYVKSSLSYLTSASAQRIDLIGIGIGYQKIFNEKYLFTASFDKSFYNTNSFSVSSSILGNLGSSFYYLNDVVDIGTSLGAIFTTGKSDVSFNIDFSHDFSWGDDSWSIEPTANINFSTRNYSELYSNSRLNRSSGQGPGGPGAGGSDTKIVTTAGADQLSLLNYDLSLPINYYGKGLGAYISPAFSIAQNAANINTKTISTRTIGGQTTTTTSSVNAIEKLTNYFYIEAGIYFKF